MITASNNTALGFQAASATLCSNNVAIGTCAMIANTHGQDNVAIGLKAGATQVAAGCNNIFIGSPRCQNLRIKVFGFLFFPFK